MIDGLSITFQPVPTGPAIELLSGDSGGEQISVSMIDSRTDPPTVIRLGLDAEQVAKLRALLAAHIRNVTPCP